MPKYAKPVAYDFVDQFKRAQKDIKSLLINNVVSALYNYTPVWTAATTNPVLGNGAVTGTYRRVGRRVLGCINLLPGPSTTFGTGAWSFTLPFPVTNAQSYVAYAMAKDVSANSTFIGLGLLLAGSNSFSIQLGQAAGNWSTSQPMAWASADIGAINFDYESDT